MKLLNKHTARVACATCHIPSFAKDDPTDMVRDWSTPLHHPDKGKWSATITFGKDVTPVYAWWNGRTRHQLMGEPAAPGPGGAVAVMAPDGDRDDPQARIQPFKLHRGRLPVLKQERWLVPIAVEEFFADGDIDKAVREGAEVAYGVEHADYEWVDTVRWMGIFHEVAPAGQALKCKDCHGDDGRLDWRALGYPGDPRDK